MLGGASGKVIVAFEAEGAATTRQLVVAVGVEGEVGVCGVEWFGSGDGSATWRASILNFHHDGRNRELKSLRGTL